MMRQHERTLYLATQGTTARLEHRAVRVERPELPAVRVPLRDLDSIVVYGHVNVTTELIHGCSQQGARVVYLSRGGRFIASTSGPTSGNILLRQAQHHSDQARDLEIVRSIVGAKLLNSRTLLLDAAKDDPASSKDLRRCADQLEVLVSRVRLAESIDVARGFEGQGAAVYLRILGSMASDERFRFRVRSRRPPLDRANALLSFLYALATSRCVGALEAVGLDPQLGFLHRVRPGRPSLALDLVEELRAPVVDRFALTLVNRRQISPKAFDERPGGSWELNEDGRSTVLKAWDAHLNQAVPHRAFEERIPRRDLPHTQAVLLARHLRGDMKYYLPYRTVAR